MGESGEQYAGILRSAGSLEQAANHDHPEHAPAAHETMFDESPLAVPADQAGMNLEALKKLQVAAKFGDRVAYHGESLVPPCNGQSAAEHEPLQAADIGKRQIAAVVDVQIQVQVVRPNAQRHPCGGEYVDLGRADEAEADTNQAHPRKHGPAFRQ